MAQHGFTRSLDVMAVAALGAGIVASTREIARVMSLPTLGNVVHQGGQGGVLLAPFAMPETTWSGLVVFGSDTSIGLVQLFFGRMTATLSSPETVKRPRTERIPVAVLGATGSVGQRFVQLLESHPWFRLHEVVASERSAGKNYSDAADWRLDTLLPKEAAGLTVKELGGDLESKLLFSGLDSSVAGEAEDLYAGRGCAVISNSKNHRMDDDVPLLIPEVAKDCHRANNPAADQQDGQGDGGD